MMRGKKRIFIETSARKQSPRWNIVIWKSSCQIKNQKKSKDYSGYINEIFKIYVIGKDLKKSLLDVKSIKEAKDDSKFHALCKHYQSPQSRFLIKWKEMVTVMP